MTYYRKGLTIDERRFGNVVTKDGQGLAVTFLVLRKGAADLTVLKAARGRAAFIAASAPELLDMVNDTSQCEALDLLKASLGDGAELAEMPVLSPAVKQAVAELLLT